MTQIGCKHSTHTSFPKHDLSIYTKMDFCLNCIPCFSRIHSSPVYPSVVALHSSRDDKSFLCLGCYADLICTIFEWNYSKIQSEELKSVIESVKNYNGAIPSQDAKFLLHDIAGTLLERPFVEDNDTPDSNDLKLIKRLDSIISWNSHDVFADPRPDNDDFLSWRYSESLRDWNNFLNPIRRFTFISEYENLPSSMIDKAEGRMLVLQIL